MAALILVYDCNVKDGSAAASYQVSNTVTLSNGSKSSDSGITYQVKADATATTAQVRAAQEGQLLRRVAEGRGVHHLPVRQSD